ncbi:hypothetical protein [Nostoc sp. NMS8]|uniref:hypothetical protein n=1 Tax=Nostoc sp. NMS8 TaxID=2815392 RepID=UPI0025E9F22C|nr:hypothetical protein [Nostoc sp. NMS8]MBN3958242.1 hypothetical protein [Nostoc sp. NMS8]
MSQSPKNLDGKTNKDNSHGSPISNNNDALPNAVIKAVVDSTTSPEKFRRFLTYFIVGVFGIVTLTWIILDKIKPNKVSLKDGTISIEANKAGTLTLEKDNKKSIIMVLSPNGGIDDEWVDPEIQIKKGDSVNITASGKINLSLAGIIKAAQEDVQPKAPWNDPKGLSKNDDNNPLYPERNNFKTMKEYPFGMLIAAIRKDNLSLDKYQIGNERKFKAETDGKLLLTVNDIWLSAEKKDAYLPPEPTGRNREYYLNKVLGSINSDTTIATQQFLTWNKGKQDSEIMNKYNERKKKWDELNTQRNYGLWYQDNIGSFAVTITIER